MCRVVSGSNVAVALEAPKAGATPYTNPEQNKDRAHHISEDLVIATPLTQEKEGPLSDPFESLDTVGENTDTTFAGNPHTEGRKTTDPTNTYREWVL